MSDLKKIAKEIRDAIESKQNEMSLSFIEDSHTYFIKGTDGKVTSDMPSVSTVLKSFYIPFNAKNTWSFKKCGGDKVKEKALLKEWSDKGSYATNMGSRVHFILEQELVNQYGKYKEVRKPIFKVNDEQKKTGDQMIIAGKEYLDMMHDRGAVLIDTEMVLGSLELGYFGQPDKAWLMTNKEGEVGLVISDWKSNQPKNFEVHSYTKLMLKPFQKHWDTSLSHYYIQLPLYARLILDMLKGSKHENLKFFGGVVVLLKKDGEFEEHKIPQDVINEVMTMDIKKYI